MTAASRLAVPELPDLLERRDLTVDDVAGLPEDLHYELIDGRLVLTPSPSLVHQSLVPHVAMACMAGQPPDVVVSVDQSVMIDGHNERRPDVVGVRLGASDVGLPGAHDLILAIEIVSPSSVGVDGEDKRKVYADAGVPHYWIIDPLAERVTLTEFVLARDGVYRRGLHTTDRASLEHPWKITLDLPSWTERRDLIRRARRTR